MSSSVPDEIRTVVDRVCAEMRLSRFDANTVELWVRSDPASWPSCCMGGCDPCNDVLRTAARKVLETLDD